MGMMKLITLQAKALNNNNKDIKKKKMIKVITPEGKVKIYNHPIKAIELMEEYPKHMICHSDSFLIGQKVPPLLEKDTLKAGNSYFLLPSHFFHSVLSLLTITRTTSNYIKSFDVRKTPSGSLQIRVVGEEQVVTATSQRLCTSEVLEKEYKQLGCNKRTWKPKLETIRECHDLEQRRRQVVSMGVLVVMMTTLVMPCGGNFVDRWKRSKKNIK